MEERLIIGRNSVIEAFRARREIERLFLLRDANDGPLMTIQREAKKRDTMIDFVAKSRLDQIAKTDKHQGVCAYAAAVTYASVEDILERAAEKNEPPFVFVLDHIEDPHNLGAIIRTANLCGAHGVIIPDRRGTSLTATAAKASAGAVYHTPVARVGNLSQVIDELKDKGLWFVCADMDGESMYDLNLIGPMGLVIGNEGAGVSPKIRKHCDFVASIPMKGDIDSLNVSVAAGILAFEIAHQRAK